MKRSAAILWRWGRGVLAVALAYFIIGLALVHTGGQISARLPVIGVALVSLVGILVGIWKSPTLEIMAWVALLLVIFAAMMG
jgi:hypothetical protein